MIPPQRPLPARAGRGRAVAAEAGRRSREFRHSGTSATNPGRQELTAFCTAVGDGADIGLAAADFGRACCGLLTESELERCLIALLAGELSSVSADPAAVIAAARAGHRRQAEAFRFTALLVDPLSGLDSESRLVSELWEAAAAGRPTWLVVLSPTVRARSRSWISDLEVGLLRRPLPGRLSMVKLESGDVLMLTDTLVAAQDGLAEFARRLPLLAGRVVAVQPAASIADLAWWLVGVLAADPAPDDETDRDSPQDAGDV